LLQPKYIALFPGPHHFIACSYGKAGEVGTQSHMRKEGGRNKGLFVWGYTETHNSRKSHAQTPPTILRGEDLVTTLGLASRFESNH